LASRNCTRLGCESKSLISSRKQCLKCTFIATNHPLEYAKTLYYKHAKSLAKRYKDITLVAPQSRPPDDAYTGTIKLRWLNPSSTPFHRLVRLFQAVREVRRISPDICHFYDLDILAIVPWLSRICTVPPVYDALEAWPERMLCSEAIPRFLRPLAARCTDVVEKRMARRCCLVLTADEATANDFERRGIKTQTLFNFPPLSLFEPEPASLSEIRQRYKARTIAIYHGSMTEDRGLFHMLRATQLVAAQENAFLLMLIGLADGELKRRTISLIHELQIDDHVEILPWIPHVDIAAYIRMAKVGLAPLQPIPKYYKNIPQKIFEYMACGVPVVGSNLPTIAPFLRKTEAGLVVDCTRPDLLAEGIMSILGNDFARQSMGRKGRRAFRRYVVWGG